MSKIKTKEFWQTVREEYTISYYSPDNFMKYELCYHSNSFQGAWDIRYSNYCKSTRFEIINLAKLFINEKYCNGGVITGTMWLFHCGDINSSFQVRLEFIDWCINKFE